MNFEFQILYMGEDVTSHKTWDEDSAVITTEGKYSMNCEQHVTKSVLVLAKLEQKETLSQLQKVLKFPSQF